MEYCFFCGHPMINTHAGTIIRNGEARQLTEFVCSNPDCGAPKVLDRPLED